ncbi:CLAVATA3/ESR (CLE)-related protein 25-like [Lycium ferocissimum]|uniref:CLAVATA3/ESR (CLE)-related protein 25-like n=1 Tax=Lycium ferocissimum TaxID=112874 RepID=UPI002815BBD4|nr:CLAVATA3/ESR (CLE)-related protein 25-like [Lycium ferocissimum]
MDSSSKIRLYKGLWGSIVVLGVVCLLVGVLENRETKILKKQNPNIIHSRVNLNFMSIKRRVPNGHNPIHNRGAGNSHQPPRQVSKGELGKP